MFDRSPSSEETASPDGGSLRCPRCGGRGAPGDLYCEVDGARLVGAAAPPPAGEAPAGCPCGAAADDGDGYCSRCGHRIASGARPAAAVSTAPAPSADLGAATDRGLCHPSNEDAVALARAEVDGEALYVLVVCDGVSSSYDAAHAATVAADAARDALLRYARTDGGVDPSAAMVDAVRHAHRAACTQAAPPPDGQDPAGTTLVAALVQRGQVTLGWVGDSRAYWVAPGGAGLLTRDHSWVTEVVDRGEMDEATALRSPGAHALTHCLGPLEEAMGDGAPEPAVTTFQPPPGCRLVLCSDGLWNYAAGAAEIAALVGQAAPDASAAAIAQSLVAYALTRGGQDNVTAAVALLA